MRARPIVLLLTAMFLAAGPVACSRKEPPSQAQTQPSAAPAPGAEKPIPPAPKPTGPLPRGASCQTPECHASYARASYIHGPVSQQACDACHADDAGGHRYPLKRDKIATCTFCHAVIHSAAVQHVAAQQGCGVCHQSHASGTKFLLKYDSIEQLCGSCHKIPRRRFAHGPFAKGQCTVCHLPHQADNRYLLRGGPGPDHCFTCHADVRKTLASTGRLHEPVKTKCVSCHNPHTSDFEFLQAAPVGQSCYACHEKLKKRLETSPVTHSVVSTGLRCANCHNPHGTAWPHLLPERMDKICLRCHDRPVKAADGHMVADMKPVLTASKFRHGPVKYGTCTGCHDSHAAGEASLLIARFPKTFYAPFNVENYALCFLCHEKQVVLQPKTKVLTEFRNGDVNMHYLHVNRDPKGRTCKACHAVHGSDLPNHMAADVPFEGSGWAMPIQYEKTPDGGRCAPGCHGPAGYDRRQPVKNTNTIRGAQ
ncbi:MAG: cytochrome c3 family protein [Planctomycetota bacterium]|nr:cytochrome c3 family protein [Planctomycetota bacterium]